MINPTEVELLLRYYPNIVVTEGFDGYLFAELEGDFINPPQSIVVSKLSYRYFKWKVAWDAEFERLKKKERLCQSP